MAAEYFSLCFYASVFCARRGHGQPLDPFLLPHICRRARWFMFTLFCLCTCVWHASAHCILHTSRTAPSFDLTLSCGCFLPFLNPKRRLSLLNYRICSPWRPPSAVGGKDPPPPPPFHSLLPLLSQQKSYYNTQTKAVSLFPFTKSTIKHRQMKKDQGGLAAPGIPF